MFNGKCSECYRVFEHQWELCRHFQQKHVASTRKQMFDDSFYLETNTYRNTDEPHQKLNDMNEGSEKSKLAFQIFCKAIRKYLGAYYLEFGGHIDAIIFR